MTSELAKIEAYFAEAKRLWAVNAELVSGRPFYEAWESAQQPRPFRFTSAAFTLAQQELELPEPDGCIGYMTWDEAEAYAALVVEAPACERRYALLFVDGEAHVQEQPIVFQTETELTFGERLEIMYDVVAFAREHQPTRDLLQLSRRSFQNLLRAVAPRHDRHAIAVMNQLRPSSIQKLLAKAVEDMPADELGNQLVLPLDGTYAASGANPVTVAELAGGTLRALRLATRTRWAVQQDLELLQAACLAIAGLVEAYVLPFIAMEILSQNGAREFTVRIPAPSAGLLTEGERMPVFLRGERGAVGTLQVDLLERAAVLGRFTWTDQPLRSQLDGELYAKQRRGPSEFLAGMVNSLVQSFRSGGATDSPALNAVLGLAPVSCAEGPLTVSGTDLDAVQLRACANAVHAANPVVLIQGPPGTGKTHVLEQVLRELVRQGARVLITAPSHTAVDNICRRVLDQPILRTGIDRNSLAPEIAESCWIQEINAVRRFVERRQSLKGSLYAGTPVGLLRDEVIAAELEKKGKFDVLVFDEAGMARMDEFLLLARLAQRAVLFGDHQQLPPFPLPDEVLAQLKEQRIIPRRQWRLIAQSALEWLIEERQYPVVLLQSSYRCQNPRLMRFSSTLFYDARVRASHLAEYYQLSFSERQARYPAGSLVLYRTSALPAHVRHEQLILEGHKPGLENALEARLCLHLLAGFAQRYPLREITIIAPYRRQVRLLRSCLPLHALRALVQRPELTESEWEAFIHNRIATVDSFQGGESDAVITCYVRSNEKGSIGFVDDPQRINVAHTRCRREMAIVADIDFLQAHARNPIFARMARAVSRDGLVIDVTPELVKQLPKPPG